MIRPSAVIARVPVRPLGLPSVAEPLERLWHAIGGHKKIAAGLILLLPIVILSFAAPALPLPDYLETSPIEAMQGPSLDHPFGTDKLGRDVLSRTLAGARISLSVGFAVAVIAVGLGVVIGTASVFFGRVADTGIMTVVDILLSFPGLLLAIALVAVFGPGIPQVIAAIVISDLPRAVRLQRSLALELKGRSFIDAARMVSAPTWWLLVRHVIPNTIAPMLVVAGIYAANAIVVEASLSFLGLGIVPPQPSWGNLMREGQRYLLDGPWISTFPGLLLLLVAISLHWISDGVRSSLDPSLRTR
jgi:peptide/nickel transport system permease protein